MPTPFLLFRASTHTLHQAFQQVLRSERETVQRLHALLSEQLETMEVRLTFPDGSSFDIPVLTLLDIHANTISLPGVDPAEHLTKQLLPAIENNPTLLAEFAKALSIDQVYLAATHVFMCTPAIVLRTLYTPADSRISILHD